MVIVEARCHFKLLFIFRKIGMSFQSKKILLLGAGFTTRNMGVWALASGAITSVLHAYPDAQVYLLDYHSEPSIYEVRHHRGTALVHLVNLRFSKKIWLPNNIVRLLLTVLAIRALPSRSLQNRLISRNFWLHHIQTADIVGSIAGGDSFSDIYGFLRLIYVTLPQILVLLIGKPLVLLPQTIGPFKGAFGKTIARYILRRARMIYSRDKDSLLAARELLEGDHGRLECSYDMGFVLEPQINEERMPRWFSKDASRAPLVGVNVSGLLYIGGYTKRNMFGLKADYRRLVHDLIDYFVRKHNAHVMLVPHVFGAAENSESDVIACREIYREAKEGLRESLHLIEEQYDQHELKALIGRCDFFLGSRMHACIAALSQCIPAVGLAYSRKFRGVFASIGMEKLVIDLCAYDNKSVIEVVDRAYEHRLEFRAQLEAKMPTVRASVLELFTRFSIETTNEKATAMKL